MRHAQRSPKAEDVDQGTGALAAAAGDAIDAGSPLQPLSERKEGAGTRRRPGPFAHAVPSAVTAP